MATITMSIRTEPEMKAKLEYIKKNSGLSLSDTIKAALYNYCNQYEQEKGEIPIDYIEERAAQLLKGRK